MDLGRRLRPTALGLAGVLSVLMAWQLLRLTDAVPANSLPGPAVVFRRIPDLLSTSEFRRGLLDTMQTWALALALASAVGVTIGVLAHAIPGLAKPVALAVDALRSVPSTALIPIAILLWGLGTEMKVAVALYAIVWPVLINTSYGLAGIEPMRIDAARSMHLNWTRKHLYVSMPSALPSIFTGIRIASATALVVIISTELLGAQYGVGTVLVSYQHAGRADYVIAGTLMVGLLGVAVYTAITAVEGRLVTWASVV